MDQDGWHAFSMRKGHTVLRSAIKKRHMRNKTELDLEID